MEHHSAIQETEDNFRSKMAKDILDGISKSMSELVEIGKLTNAELAKNSEAAIK